MELPERLRDHGDHAEDDEEVLQPQGYMGGISMNMNQSIFSMIAAAGSQVDFTDRFEGQSSDDEDEADSAMAMTVAGHKVSARRDQGSGASSMAQTMLLRKSTSDNKKDGHHHHRKISGSRLLRSVPGLSRLTSRSKSGSSKGKGAPEAQIQEEAEDMASPSSSTDPATPAIELGRAEGRLAPVMSRMLEARAQMAARPSFDLERLSSDQIKGVEEGETGPSELAKRLKDIFEFDEPEEVIEEYPCWLLQHVLLQGYMYITRRHIAFYAYLPKKAVRVSLRPC